MGTRKSLLIFVGRVESVGSRLLPADMQDFTYVHSADFFDLLHRLCTPRLVREEPIDRKDLACRIGFTDANRPLYPNRSAFVLFRCWRSSCRVDFMRSILWSKGL